MPAPADDDLAILPALPPVPPAGLLIFSGRQWDWITRAIKAVYKAQDAQLVVLAPLTTAIERNAMATDDLSNAVGRAEAATTASLAAQSMEIQQLRDAVAALGTAPTAAELAAFKDRANAIADRLEAGTASLGADDPAATP